MGDENKQRILNRDHNAMYIYETESYPLLGGIKKCGEAGMKIGNLGVSHKQVGTRLESHRSAHM